MTDADFDKLAEYVMAYERVWKSVPDLDLEILFVGRDATERDTIIAQLYSDADHKWNAAEGRDLGDKSVWDASDEFDWDEID